jgi:N-acetylmuramoyl-L-alanine amidase CwlA
MEIKDYLTTRNFTKRNNRKIEYIVIHYVGAVSSALNNAKYFKTTYRGASAHYFVDEKDIYRVVEDKDNAWHSGANKYKHAKCRNSNSIGIEMCCYKNGNTIDVSEKVVERTIELTKELMAKYNIPVENVLRHYDVTGKNCPAPMVSDSTRWNTFKARLTNITVKKSIEEVAREVINGAWGTGAERRTKLTNAGYDYNLVQSKVNDILAVANIQYYPKCKATYLSLTSALSSIGVDSSFANRKKIALANGTTNYTGTFMQNVSMLNKLKSGRLRKV